MRRCVTLAALLLGGCGPSEAQDWYVDYAGGRDNAAGSAPASAWQHAPGDPAATGNAAAARPGPGDTVHFKGGTAYRGSIKLAWDGAEGRPLTFTGTGFGPGRAIIDGADPVTVKPCPSAGACGGAANWHDLALATFAPPPTGFVKLYDAQGPLVEAQSPAPADAFFADEVAGYAESPLSEKPAIEAGRLHAPALVRLLGGKPQGVLSIWVASNQVARRAVTGIDGDTLLFTPGDLTLYANRPGRYALLGAVAAITAPGQYAVIAPGTAVVRLRPRAGALSVGNGRGGFDIAGHVHIAITGFIFARQTGAQGAVREGLAVVSAQPAAKDLSITGNRFENSAMWNGQGVITLRNVDGATVSGNTIDTIERGSGLRAGANVTGLKVAGNSIRRIGRTGIAFLGVADSSITGNVIEGLRGIHGNGISLYLNNRRIAVSGNRVTATARPMTFHGDKTTTAPGDHDFVIERNIFVSTNDGQPALISWGAATRGVTIRGNVLLGKPGGMLLNGGDSGVVVTGNLNSGTAYNHGEGAGWRISGNRDAASGLRYTEGGPVAPLCAAAGIAPGQMLGGLKC